MVAAAVGTLLYLLYVTVPCYHVSRFLYVLTNRGFSKSVAHYLPIPFSTAQTWLIRVQLKDETFSFLCILPAPLARLL